MGWPAVAAIIGGSVLGNAASQKAARDGREALEKAGDISNAQFNKMLEQYEKSVQGLQEIGIPSIEAQKIALEYAQLGPSALEQITSDPRLAAEQYDSLKQMGELSGPGLTPEDRAEQFMISRGASNQAQARDKSILQNMKQRGVGGSGMELAARLQGSQGAADRAAMQQAQMISDRRNAKMGALTAKANLAGSMEAAQYGRDANKASARDRIEQFNKTQRAGTRNQEQMANKALIQQDYQNRMDKEQAIANARSGLAGGIGSQAKNSMARGIAEAKGHAQGGETQAQLFGDLAKAGATYFAEDGGVMGYLSVPNSNAGYEDGGLTDGGLLDEDGIPSVPDSGLDEDTRYLGGDVVPGDSYAGDRVDAKVNSGEMVLNIEQQQRLMDLLRGLKDLQGLGDEDIVSPAGGEMAPEMGMPPEGEQPPMIPDGQEVPFKHGGMVPAEYDGDKHEHGRQSQPRGIHSSLESEKKQLETQDGQQKARKARIKALEILKNGGR